MMKVSTWARTIVFAISFALALSVSSVSAQEPGAGEGGPGSFVLVVSDRSARVLAEIPLKDGRFDHMFVHSFHLTPVVERFRVTLSSDGLPLMQLFELEYQTPGAGMPSDAENGFRLVDGKFLLAMDRTFAVIPLMVSIVPGHGIIAGGSFRPFTDLVPPETMLFLAAKAVLKTSSPGGIDR